MVGHEKIVPDAKTEKRTSQGVIPIRSVGYTFFLHDFRHKKKYRNNSGHGMHAGHLSYGHCKFSDHRSTHRKCISTNVFPMKHYISDS